MPTSFLFVWALSAEMWRLLSRWGVVLSVICLSKANLASGSERCLFVQVGGGIAYPKKALVPETYAQPNHWMLRARSQQNNCDKTCIYS